MQIGSVMQSTTDPVHVMILDGVGYESRKREIESGSGSGGRDEGGRGAMVYFAERV